MAVPPPLVLLPKAKIPPLCPGLVLPCPIWGCWGSSTMFGLVASTIAFVTIDGLSMPTIPGCMASYTAKEAATVRCRVLLAGLALTNILPSCPTLHFWVSRSLGNRLLTWSFGGGNLRGRPQVILIVPIFTLSCRKPISRVPSLLRPSPSIFFIAAWVWALLSLKSSPVSNLLCGPFFLGWVGGGCFGR